MNDESTNWVKRHRADIIAGLLVVLFFGISLFIRVYLPYDKVFVGEWVKYTSVDAYFQMRLVDSLVHNFPRLIDFDPYLLYPFGMRLDNIHFFNWFLAGIIWVIGLGSPTQHTIDVIAVYFPAVLAALTVIPVFFIGKELFGRWAGVIAAGLIAILPGEYMGRSILGFTDHHVAETLLTALTMMFLIMAVKRAKESSLTLKHLWHRDWAVIRKPIYYSALAGLSMGIYLVTWIGGLLFVFIILLYLLIQFTIDHLKQNRTDYLLPSGTITFLVALVIYVLFVGGTFTTRPSSLIPWLSLLIAMLFPVILRALSLRFTGWNIKPYYYPVTLFVLAVVALFIGRAIYPDFMRNVLDVFNMFASRTIIEMQAFLHPVKEQEWTTVLAWGNFNTSFFLFPSYIDLSPEFQWFEKLLVWFPGFSIISLGILIYLTIKHGDADKTMLVIWSLVILLATIGQRRFAYYLVTNVALLTGFLSWQFFKMNQDIQPRARHINIFISVAMIIFLLFYQNINPIIVAVFVALFIAYLFWQFCQIFGILRFTKAKLEMPRKHKHKVRKSTAGFSSALYYTNIAVVVIVLFFLVFFPSIDSAKDATAARYAPPNAWMRSLIWLKENTAEPFADSNFYYHLYEPPPAGEQYPYPDSAYAVMTWVDFGYWITRIAHRPVNLTPGPGGFHVATYFLSQDENSSQEVDWYTAWEQGKIPESKIINKLGAKYVMLDNETTTNKLHALAFWAKQERTKYYDVYLEPKPDNPNMLVGKTFLHPEYYRSLAVRLYNFDGEAVTPEQIEVISYSEKPLKEGGTIKVISDKKFFPSYEEAKNYIAEQKSGQFQIVGESPFTSAVPLEKLEHFKLVYGSPDSMTIQPGGDNMSLVKIFEYVE